jgi:hypothetical protein
MSSSSRQEESLLNIVKLLTNRRKGYRRYSCHAFKMSMKGAVILFLILVIVLQCVNILLPTLKLPLTLPLAARSILEFCKPAGLIGLQLIISQL